MVGSASRIAAPQPVSRAQELVPEGDGRFGRGVVIGSLLGAGLWAMILTAVIKF